MRKHTKYTEAWKPTDQHVEQAVGAHIEWLESDGELGEQLDLGWADLINNRKIAVAPCLDRAILENANLANVKLDGRSLKKSNFSGASLKGTHFVECDITEANFAGATWNGANFTDAKGENANFSGCKVEGSGGVVFADARLPSVELTRADLTRANLSNVNFQDAVATEATFDRANMKGASLASARLRGALLRHVRLDSANLNEADCEDADFSGARLHSAELTGGNFERAKFYKAEFDLANVRDSIFIDAEGLFGPDRAALDKMRSTEWLIAGNQGDRFTWELIRGVGSLAIFSASGFSLAAIVTYAAVARSYNHRLASFLEEAAARGLPTDYAATILGPLAMPWELGVLLAAIGILTAGSMLFRWLCPAQIREYTELRWVRELQAPRLEYLAASYSNRRMRYVTGALFCLGGGYILLYALWRFLLTMWFAFL